MSPARPLRQASSSAEILEDSLCARYDEVRSLTERLCEPLAVEDYCVQSMPDASPAKWHLAHTTWFFETFVLADNQPRYRPFHPRFAYLFNSYYNALGDRWPRAYRGVLSRPTVAEVYSYRAAIDEQVRGLLCEAEDGSHQTIEPLVILGLNHEQQHQELLLTDLKHAFGSNPLRPAYREQVVPGNDPVPPAEWIHYPAGVRSIGYEGGGFAYDNETPRHRVFVESFLLASRPVTCGEFRAFMEDGGYERPEVWLSDGWDARRSQGWTAPLYWEKQGESWWTYMLSGPCPVRDDEPVCHVSYYEAEAYARWAGARLPTEAEWETAANECPLAGNFLDSGALNPRAISQPGVSGRPVQLFGDVWEWTASPYVSYPGYQPPPGALGEYNGKFMCNQMVLRGGSCATPCSHFRRTYRNFFPPDARWQFTGIRMARQP
jgi:ergothioneine biosynthesis protein EgtB